MLEIAILVVEKKNIKKKLREHKDKYWFIQNDYKHSTRLDEVCFEKQINKLFEEGSFPRKN